MKKMIKRKIKKEEKNNNNGGGFKTGEFGEKRGSFVSVVRLRLM